MNTPNRGQDWSKFNGSLSPAPVQGEETVAVADSGRVVIARSADFPEPTVFIEFWSDEEGSYKVVLPLKEDALRAVIAELIDAHQRLYGEQQ